MKLKLHCLFSIWSVVVLMLGRVAAADAPVGWLDRRAPGVASGVSFGVPWPSGAVKPGQALALTAGEGQALPVQTWPLAYWPDGSLKWSGVATVAGAEAGGPFKLTTVDVVPKVEGAATLRVRKSDTTVEVDTGKLRARVALWGANLIESLWIDGREVARQGRLVGIVQEGPDGAPEMAPKRERFTSKVTKVTVEQSGPVRAVLKVEGTHKAVAGSREWLPFSVRMYFYAGQEAVRMVHTIVYDGDEQKDFVRGLGLEFGVPLREETQNRHVRFSGEDGGLWAEPIQPLVGRGGRFVANPVGGADVYPEQLAGKRVPNRAQLNERGQALLGDWAGWDSFKLVQANADGFSIVKRTNPASAWIPAGAGKRASGLVFVGDVAGGLGVSVKNFWQSHPSSLEVANATSGEATLRVWFWSPEADAMDMRHYDTRAHGLDAVYEDVQPGLSTPLGVARTSELTLWPSAGVPSRTEAAQQAQLGAQPPLMVCPPEYLHAVKALGLWSLSDKSTPFKQAIEANLESTLAYYMKQVDVQRWYGFWDFGDFMHSFDGQRHVWNYDLGGMAWDNTELGTDLWLWTSFLRTGRADVFRLAEAMTRHTSEVDCYHLGALAGLGSRHNVRHWGCGAKEARVSMAGLRRHHHFLTTDERSGDIMRAVLNVDYKAIEFDPMRLAQPITEAEKKYPARIRGGPDWLAFVSNWMTEWERTGETKWRDKIIAGVESMQAMPYWMKSGKNLVFGYDPKTGKLSQVSNEVGSYNLATIQGGAQVVFELNEFFDHAGWQKMWLQYCRIGGAPAAVLQKDQETGEEGADGSYLGEQGAQSQGTARLAAYAYYRTKNPVFAKAAVQALGRIAAGGVVRTQRVEGPLALNAFDEAARLGTNGAAQSGLTAIEILALCADALPAEVPSMPAIPGGRGGRGGRGGVAPGAPVPAPATPPQKN